MCRYNLQGYTLFGFQKRKKSLFQKDRTISLIKISFKFNAIKIIFYSNNNIYIIKLLQYDKYLIGICKLYSRYNETRLCRV